jgi:hypothetical protein
MLPGGSRGCFGIGIRFAPGQSYEGKKKLSTFQKLLEEKVHSNQRNHIRITQSPNFWIVHSNTISLQSELLEILSINPPQW